MKLYFVLGLLICLSACSMNQNTEQQIFQAIHDGNKNRVFELVRDINSSDQEGTSLLMSAAWHGKDDIAQWLLENGAIIDQEDNYAKTALIYAADKGYASTVKLLLAHGADINKVDGFSQWKPLDYAAARDHEDVVKIMLDLKKDELSQEDRQHAAHLSKNVQIQSLLLGKKVLK